MNKSFYNFQLKAEDGAEEGVVSGYGSIYGVEDLGGDVVVRGAFKASLAARMPKMLWQHDSGQVIGVWSTVEDSEVGLKLVGKLALTTQKGREVYDLLKMGALDGLSIGYRTVDSEWAGEVRRIKAAELYEVSLVTFPMNTLARVDAVKATEMTEREMEETLRDAGLSRAVAKKLMAGGMQAVKGTREAADDREELKSLLEALQARVNLLSH